MKRKMSLQDTLEFVPDDLPDGAYWMMAHEIAGAEYGDAWEELESHPDHKPFNPQAKPRRTIKCTICNKMFRRDNDMRAHRAAVHLRRLKAGQTDSTTEQSPITEVTAK